MNDELQRVTQDFIFGTLATDDLRLAALRTAHRGLTHANQIIPADPEPEQPVEVLVSAGTEIDTAEVFGVYTVDGTEPDAGSPRFACEPGEVVWDTLLWGYQREWHGTIPPQPDGTLVRYRLAARTVDGELIWAESDPDTGVAATFAYHVDRERVPAWVRDAIIYQIFVDRFSPGADRSWRQTNDLTGFCGGTIRGVIDALPYLTQLGVTCLWLSPVFPSPSHHGYDATDYLSIEPRLGTTDDLAELFVAAHERGLRVLLDFTANHVSNRHPAFRKAATDHTAPERAWFTFINWPDEYRSFFGVRGMPQLDTEAPGARVYLIDAANHWLRLGADGFRLDYANGPTHAFWSRFRAATRATRADSFTVGEVVETAELQRSYLGRLDGTLDFLLLQQLRAFFAFETITAAQFDAFLTRHLAYFPANFVLSTFLDNHDMNRFLWITQGDSRRLKLAALCQFTLPHPPIIYYGTEVGLSQRHDLEYPDGRRLPEESRTLMPWGSAQDDALLRFYRELIALRHRTAVLWRGRRTTLVARDGLYVVSVHNGKTRGVVVLNRSDFEEESASAGELTLVTENGVRRQGSTLVMPPMSGAVMIG